MKKFVALLLAMVMMMSLLAACGSSEKETAEETQAPVAVETTAAQEQESPEEETSGNEVLDRCMAALDGILDLSNYDEPDADEESVDLNHSDLQKLALDYVVSVADGDVFELPCLFQEMLDAGWSATMSIPEELEKNTYTTSWLENEDGQTFAVSVYNVSEDTLPIGECYVAFVQINAEVTEFEIDGITNRSTVADVIEAMGEPHNIYFYADEVDELTLTYHGEHGNLTVDFDLDAGTIFRVVYSYSAYDIA